jgi:hypothetical protein
VGEARPAVVDARCPWNASGVLLEAGARYRVTASKRPGHDWVDDANPSRLDTGWERWRWFGRLVQPRARAPHLPMYALVAAQGATHQRLSLAVAAGGVDALVPAGETPVELFLFANDWPGFYGNNQGCLDVTLQRIE